MTYESWRISYQSSEQAARAAYAECARLCARLEAAEKEANKNHIGLFDNIGEADKAVREFRAKHGFTENHGRVV